MGWREWLIALGLTVMGGLLFAALTTMVRADPVWVCNKPLCEMRWDPGAPPASAWEVQVDIGGQPPSYRTVTEPRVVLPPPDHALTTPMRLRAIALNGGSTGSDWGPWSDWVKGSPIGWMPLGDRDRTEQQILPADHNLFFHCYAIEDCRWP